MQFFLRKYKTELIEIIQGVHQFKMMYIGTWEIV